MARNPRAVEARNKRSMNSKKYQDALAAFLTAMEIEDDTAFEVIAGPSQTVVKHVVYTRQDNGTMSGDFWTDVVTRDND